MTKERIATAILGVALLSGAVTAHFVVSRYRFTDDPPAATVDLHASTTGWRSHARGDSVAVALVRYEAAVRYPSEIAIDETPLLELVYLRERLQGDEILDDPAVRTSAELTSSAFEISPSERIEKEGAPPVRFAWTLTPRSEGTHHVLLSLADVLHTDDLDAAVQTLTVNGKPLPQKDLSQVDIPIRVVTIWGVSRRSFEVIKAAAALTGFVLTYPLWIEAVRRRLGWSKESGPRR